MQDSIFHSVDVERFQMVKRLLLKVLDMPASERDAYLKEQCGNDDDLKQQVENLLKLEMRESFMEQGAIAEFGTESEPEPLTGYIGRIKIDQLLARGGMGDIYVGKDELLERTVAIKLLGNTLRSSPVQRANFLNEAKLLSTFQHPHICQVYDFIESDDQDALVMELIEGQHLRHFITESTSIKPLDILHQITQALVVAHERGIVHHDLKPENIMIDHAGNVKILDFGLAQFEQAMSNEPSFMSGTPGYMAPERANSKACSSAADMWSLGVIALELLTGKSAFDESLTRSQLIESNRLAEISIPPTLANDHRKMLQQLLAPEPSNRISARQLLHTLHRLKNRNKRRALTVAAITMLAIAGLSFWKYTHDLQLERDFAYAQQQEAESARADAEGLVNFMMTDLYSELEKVGRIKMLDGTANQVLDYYNKVGVNQAGDNQGTAAFALTRVGEVLGEQEQIEKSAEVLKQAIDALIPLHEQYPDNELITWRLGMSYKALVYTLVGSDDISAALPYADKGIELGERLTSKFAPGAGPQQHPSAHERWALLLRSHYMRIDLAMRLGNPQQYLQLLDSLVETAEQATKLEPKLAKNLADLHFIRCALFIELTYKPGVVDACQEVLESDRILHESNPENYDYYSFYMLDFATMVQAYTMQERYEEASEMARQGEYHGQQLQKLEPDNSRVINNFANIKLVEGLALAQQGNIAASRELFEQVVEITTTLLAEHNDSMTIKNNKFVAHAYLGDAEQTKVLARELADSGFQRRMFIETCQKFEIDECRSKQ